MRNVSDQPTVEFLGYTLSAEGVCMDPWRCKCFMNGQHSKALEIFSTSLSLQISTDALYGTTSKSWPLWILCYLPSPLGCRSPRILQSSEHSSHLHVHPSQSQPFILETDASNITIAAVLPRNRASTKMFIPVSTIPINSLLSRAIMKFWTKSYLLSKWLLRHYLEGSRYPVQMVPDHKNLEYLHSDKALTQQ